MTIDDLKKQISDVLSADGCAAEFYFLLDSGRGMEVKSVDITEADQTALAQMFTDAISNNILLNDDLSLISLSSADDRANAIYQYDLEDVPTELTHLKAIIESDDFGVFSFGSD